MIRRVSATLEALTNRVEPRAWQVSVLAHALRSEGPALPVPALQHAVQPRAWNRQQLVPYGRLRDRLRRSPDEASAASGMLTA